MCLARLEELIAQELVLHRETDRLLAQYYQTPTQKLVHMILALRAKIIELLSEQATVLTDLFTHPSFKTRYQTYCTVINNCFDWGSTLEEEDTLQIKLAIFKLYQFEHGKILIKELVTALGDQKINIVASGNNTMSTQHLILYYPRNYHQGGIHLVTGKSAQAPLIATVGFISCAHELIHIQHRLQKNDACDFPCYIADPNPRKWLYSLGYRKPNGEEYHTIERSRSGGVCENDIRQEAKLPLRGGWQSAQLTTDSRDPHLQKLMWLTRKAHAGFKLSITAITQLRCGMFVLPADATHNTPQHRVTLSNTQVR